MRGLVRRELLTLETDPRSPEHGQYAFVQALIREVAYNTLARPERKRRHLAAARFFESIGTDEMAGALAGHYLAAHANATDGPEAEALAGQARIALEAAAVRAVGLGANDQALRFFEQALLVTSDPAEDGRSAREGWRRSLDREADMTSQRCICDVRSTSAAISAIVLRSPARRPPSAERCLTAARRQKRSSRSNAARANSRTSTRIQGSSRSSDSSHAPTSFTRTCHPRSTSPTGPSPPPSGPALTLIIADTLVTKGTALAYLGRAIEGLGLLAAGQALAESNGLDRIVVRAIGNRASILRSRDPRSGLAIGADRHRPRPADRLRTSLSINLGNGAGCAVRTGDWPWALTEIDSVLAEDIDGVDRLNLLESSVAVRALQGDAVGDLIDGDGVDRRRKRRASDPLGALDRAHANDAFASGRLDDARDAAHRTGDLVAEYLPNSLALSARSALWMGDAAGAADDLAALDASGVHGAAIEADRTTIRAGIAALDGRPAEALPLYREAIRAWRDLGLAWDEALCGLDMATLLDPSDPEVRAAAESAREILVRLGATPFIARLDAAMSRATGPGAARGHRCRKRPPRCPPAPAS